MTFGIFGVAALPSQQDNRVSTNTTTLSDSDTSTTEPVTFILAESEFAGSSWQMLTPVLRQEESAVPPVAVTAEPQAEVVPAIAVLAEATNDTPTHPLLQAFLPEVTSQQPVAEIVADSILQPVSIMISNEAEFFSMPPLTPDPVMQEKSGLLSEQISTQSSVGEIMPVVLTSAGTLPAILAGKDRATPVSGAPILKMASTLSGAGPHGILPDATELTALAQSLLTTKQGSVGLASEPSLTPPTIAAAKSVTVSGFTSAAIPMALSNAVGTGLPSSLHQWQSLNLNMPVSQWGSTLFNTLQDKLTLQLGQQIQRAQIRLDPPQLGSIELRITIDGDKTSVQLLAAQPQIREAMQQTAELLRLSLGQHSGDASLIDVQVGEFSQQSQHFFSEEAESAILVNTSDDESGTNGRATGSHGWIDRLA